VKREAAKYNQRIGDLVVKFVDYMQTADENPTDALEIFSIQNALSANEAYQMALYLNKQGYQVDPLVFHPDYTGEEDEVTFQEYDDALLRGEHNKAHRIYESMTPTQKQVIRDRRGCMDKKIKTAQRVDTEAVIEKDVPAEDVSLVKELPQQQQETGELNELIEPAESLITQHNSLNLPPDSMRVFIPFARSLDEFKRVRNTEVPREDLRNKTEDFLKNFGKVLHYLDQQDFEVAELIDLVKKYADLFYMKPVAAMAAQKILALAAKLQERGMSDVANQLTKTIVANEIPNIIEQTEEVINKSPVELYQEALVNEDFDQAREIYLHMSPQQRQIADEFAKKHFAIQSIISLYRVGESLFNKGKIKEADEVSNVVKAQFVELPGKMQQEIILLIVPENHLDQLPQAFQGGKSRGFNMEDKLTNMQKRLIPEGPQGVPCASCGCSAKTIIQLLKVADTLDQKGQIEAADEITNALAELTKEAQAPTSTELTPEEIEKILHERLEPPISGREIGILKCQSCGADVLYDRNKKEKPQYCTYCAKMLSGSPWTGARIAKKACDDQIEGGLADSKPDEEFDAEELEKGTKVEMEHTNDEELAKEIASDHLAEDDDYYKKLDVMEHSELKKMEKKEGKKAKEKKAAMPGPFDPYTSVPLGGAAKEKAEEQEARKTRLVDPTGIQGPVDRPSFITLYQDGKPVRQISRERAKRLDTEGKIDLNWVEGELRGEILDPKVLQQIEREIAGVKIRSFTKSAAEKKDDHGGKPAKVVEIADAIRRDNPEISDAKSYAMAWETFCSYVNPGYEGCTSKGKSHRESPKPYEIKD
jgi:hypothetical protein